MSRRGNSEVGEMGSENRSPLVTDQMESSLALLFSDFADVAPKKWRFWRAISLDKNEQSPHINISNSCITTAHRQNIGFNIVGCRQLWLVPLRSLSNVIMILMH